MSSTRKLYSPKTIIEGVAIIRQIFSHIENVRKQYPEIGSFIQNPKLSTRMTESLAIHLLNNGLIPELSRWTIGFGRGDTDIVATKDEARLKIELKTSGPQGFQQLGRKDTHCDFLIWIAFDDYFFNSNKKTFDVYHLKNPQRYLSEIYAERRKRNTELKISIKEFLKITSPDTVKTTLPLESIDTVELI